MGLGQHFLGPARLSRITRSRRVQRLNWNGATDAIDVRGRLGLSPDLSVIGLVSRHLVGTIAQRARSDVARADGAHRVIWGHGAIGSALALQAVEARHLCLSMPAGVG
jgi:hypothetical protein